MLINFIIELLELADRNAICIVIDKLTQERYYIVCIATDKSIFVEAIVDILFDNMFKYYNFSISITFDQDS